jgi:hypothetical protein
LEDFKLAADEDPNPAHRAKYEEVLVLAAKNE